MADLKALRALRTVRSQDFYQRAPPSPQHHIRWSPSTSVNSSVFGSVYSEGARRISDRRISENSMQPASLLPDGSRSMAFAEVWHEHGTRGVLQKLLQSSVFEAFMCAVVLANSCSMGVEQSFRLERWEPPVFVQLEMAFMAVYILELLLQFAAYGVGCLKSNWVRFDLFLVVAAAVGDWVIIPNVNESSGERLQSLSLLRTARLLRLARTVRLIVKLKELRMLVLGLGSSLAKLLPTLGLGAILLYVVGCAGLELIPLAMLGKPGLDPEVAAIIEVSFPSLPMTMLTLLQFLTFDGAHEVYKPLINEDGSLAFFFVFALLVLGVVFMNLITAAMVSRGLEQAMEDKIMRSAVAEARRRGLIMDLEKAFHAADTNNSGSLSREEVATIDEEQKEVLHSIFGVESLVQFFDCLDTDGNGELGIEEFCHGLEGILLSQVPMEVKRVEQLVQSLSLAAKESQALQAKTAQAVEAISEQLRQLAALQAPPCLPVADELTPVASCKEPKLSEEAIELRDALDEACKRVLSMAQEGSEPCVATEAAAVSPRSSEGSQEESCEPKSSEESCGSERTSSDSCPRQLSAALRSTDSSSSWLEDGHGVNASPAKFQGLSYQGGPWWSASRDDTGCGQEAATRQAAAYPARDVPQTDRPLFLLPPIATWSESEGADVSSRRPGQVRRL